MYLPKQFEQTDHSMCMELMQEYNFATLISNDDSGLPFVSHLPLIVSEQNGRFTIEGHVAKGNPHWKYWERDPHVLSIFHGPHAYLSPKVYPDPQRVPTWNYLVVHVSGKIQLIHDQNAKEVLLKRLIEIHEPEYAEQWRSLGSDFQSRLLDGIVAFKFDAEKLQGKFKVNQHRKESHAAMKAAYQKGTQNEVQLFKWMERLGL